MAINSSSGISIYSPPPGPAITSGYRPVAANAYKPAAAPLPLPPAPVLASDPASQLRYYSGWQQKAIPVYAPKPAAPANATAQQLVAAKSAPMAQPISYNYEVYDPQGRKLAGKTAEDYLNFAKSDLYKQYGDYGLANPLNASYGDAYYSGFTSNQLPIYGEAPPPAPGSNPALAKKSQQLPVIGQETKYYDNAGREITGTALQNYLDYVARDKAGTDTYLPSEIPVSTSNDRYYLPHTNAYGNYTVLPDVMYQGKKLTDKEKQYQYLLAMGHPAALQEKARRDLFSREQQLQTERDAVFLNSVRASTARAAYINQNFTDIPVADPNHGKEWQAAVQTYLDSTKTPYTAGYDYYGRTAEQRPETPGKYDPTAAKAAMFPDNPYFVGRQNQSSILTGQGVQNRIPERIWNSLSPEERQAIQATDAQRQKFTKVLEDPFSTFYYGVTDQDVYGDPSKKPIRGVTKGPGGVLFGGTPGAKALGWRNGNPVPTDVPGAGLWNLGMDPNDPRTLGRALDFALSHIQDRPKKGGEGGRRFDKYQNLRQKNPDGTWRKITDPKVAQQLLNDVDVYQRELAWRLDLPKRSFSIGDLFEAFIPALVGIATGNPYLAGLAGFGQAASKGDVLGMVTNVLGMGINAYGGFGKVLSNVGIKPADVISKAGSVSSIPKLNSWVSSAVKDFLDPTKVGQYSMSMGDFAASLSQNVIGPMTRMEKEKLRKEPFYGQLYGKLSSQERASLNLPPPNYSGQLEDYRNSMSKLTEFAGGAGKTYSDDWATQAQNYIAGTQPQTAAKGGLMGLNPRYVPMRHRAYA